MDDFWTCFIGFWIVWGGTGLVFTLADIFDFPPH